MKKTQLNKPISAALLLILAFSLIGTTTLLVQADPVGIGKYLTIDIVGEGVVTATKVKSGASWLFDETGDSYKLGAGAVLLTAIADPGWEFSSWDSLVIDVLTDENPQEIKTAKYGDLTVTFTEITFTITPNAIGNGAISPSTPQIVPYGGSAEFTFIPDTGSHTSAIAVDGVYLTSFVQSYEFTSVTANHVIDVFFSAAGEATIPGGNGITIFLDSGAGLTFDTTSAGIATGGPVDFPVGTSAVVWDITTTAIFAGGVKVTLEYDETGLSLEEEQNLRLIRGDTIYAVYSDVNGDLVVDGTDVSIIANAVNTNTQPDWYNPSLDIDNDGEVDKDDIHLVNENKGAILEDITYGTVDTDNNIIYGITDHFSIFRCR